MHRDGAYRITGQTAHYISLEYPLHELYSSSSIVIRVKLISVLC